MHDLATYFAWFVLALLFFIAACLVVWLGSMPKAIATKRNHPQVDAINACSWLGLALGGIGWPIAFVWAFLRSGDAGHSSPSQLADAGAEANHQHEISELKRKIATLEQQLEQSKSHKDSE